MLSICLSAHSDPRRALRRARIGQRTPVDPLDAPRGAAVGRAARRVARGRMNNLELLKQFGGAAWRAHNQQTSTVRDALNEYAEAVASEVDLIHRKRKSAQTAAGAEFAQLENGVNALVDKNHAIEHACEGLQRSIDEARTKMQKTAP
jgi:hypothetical protein